MDKVFREEMDGGKMEDLKELVNTLEGILGTTLFISEIRDGSITVSMSLKCYFLWTASKKKGYSN